MMNTMMTEKADDIPSYAWRASSRRRLSATAKWSEVAKRAVLIGSQCESPKPVLTNINTEPTDAETCIKLIRNPCLHTYSGLNHKFQAQETSWMLHFLELGGLGILFEAFEGLCSRGISHTISEAYILLESVACVKAVMNSQQGLDYIIENKEFTRKLATALDTDNVMVKKQVFELLSALCVYTAEGYARAIDALENYKELKKERYRFSLIIKELRTAETTAYKTTLVAFINCIIISTTKIEERGRIRNEFIGLKLLEVLAGLRKEQEQDPDLVVQLDVFDEEKANDEEQLQGPEGVDLNNHLDLFHAIYKQVCDTPQEIPFLATLQHLLQLDPNDPISDVIWETIEKLVYRATLLEKSEDSEKLLKSGYKRLEKAVAERSGSHDTGYESKDETDSIRSHNDSIGSVSSPTRKSASAISMGSSSPAPPPGVNSSPAAPPPPPPAPAPPPPPPPGMAPPGPPPPPGAPAPPGPQIKLPQQQTPVPKAKMRKLQWQKITTQKVVGTKNIWTEVGQMFNGYKVNFDVMEELFSQPEPTKATVKAKDTSPTSTMEKKRRDTEINLLDGKRSLNVNIFLKQFRIPHHEILQLLRDGASEKFGAEKLRGLLKILPVDDEIEMLRTFDGDKEKLGNAEKFYLHILTLPSYRLRVEAMLIKEEFTNNMDYIKPSIYAIIMAAKEIKECKDLHEILYLVLVAGNFLNAGGYAGNAAGFKVTSLLKLTEIRANKPKMNLLHYVVMQAQEKNPKLFRFVDSMKNLKEASQTSIESLTTDITSLRDKVTSISTQLEAQGGEFHDQMAPFMQEAKSELFELEQDLQDIEELRGELSNFFCEDKATFKLEECFRIFQTFCERFKKSIEDNKQRAIMEEKAKARQKQKEDSDSKRRGSGDAQTRSRSNSGHSATTPDDEGHIVDMLHGYIRSGFNNKKLGDANFTVTKVKKVTLDPQGLAAGVTVGSGDVAISGRVSPSPGEFTRGGVGRVSRKLQPIEENGKDLSDESSNADSLEDRTETEAGEAHKRQKRRSGQPSGDEGLLDFLINASEDVEKISKEGEFDRLGSFRRKRRERRSARGMLDSVGAERERAPSPRVDLEKQAIANSTEKKGWRSRFADGELDTPTKRSTSAERTSATSSAAATPEPKTADEALQGLRNKRNKMERKWRSNIDSTDVDKAIEHHESVKQEEKEKDKKVEVDTDAVSRLRGRFEKSDSENETSSRSSSPEKTPGVQRRSRAGRRWNSHLDPAELKSALRTISEQQKLDEQLKAKAEEDKKTEAVVESKTDVDKTSADSRREKVFKRYQSNIEASDVNALIKSIDESHGSKEPEETAKVSRPDTLDITNKTSTRDRTSRRWQSDIGKKTDIEQVLKSIEKTGKEIQDIGTEAQKQRSQTPNGDEKSPRSRELASPRIDPYKPTMERESLTEKAWLAHSTKWRNNRNESPERPVSPRKNVISTYDNVSNMNGESTHKRVSAYDNISTPEPRPIDALKEVKTPTDSSEIFVSLRRHRRPNTFEEEEPETRKLDSARKIGSRIGSRLSQLYHYDDEEEYGLSPSRRASATSPHEEETKMISTSPRDINDNKEKRHEGQNNVESDEGFEGSENVSQRTSMSSTLDQELNDVTTNIKRKSAEILESGTFDEKEEIDGNDTWASYTVKPNGIKENTCDTYAEYTLTAPPAQEDEQWKELETVEVEHTVKISELPEEVRKNLIGSGEGSAPAAKTGKKGTTSTAKKTKPVSRTQSMPANQPLTRSNLHAHTTKPTLNRSDSKESGSTKQSMKSSASKATTRSSKSNSLSVDHKTKSSSNASLHSVSSSVSNSSSVRTHPTKPSARRTGSAPVASTPTRNITSPTPTSRPSKPRLGIGSAKTKATSNSSLNSATSVSTMKSEKSAKSPRASSTTPTPHKPTKTPSSKDGNVFSRLSSIRRKAPPPPSSPTTSESSMPQSPKSPTSPAPVHKSDVYSRLSTSMHSRKSAPSPTPHDKLPPRSVTPEPQPTTAHQEKSDVFSRLATSHMSLRRKAPPVPNHNTTNHNGDTDVLDLTDTSPLRRMGSIRRSTRGITSPTGSESGVVMRAKKPGTPDLSKRRSINTVHPIAPSEFHQIQNQIAEEEDEKNNQESGKEKSSSFLKKLIGKPKDKSPFRKSVLNKGDPNAKTPERSKKSSNVWR